MGVAPFTQAQVIQEVLAAPVTQWAGGQGQALRDDRSLALGLNTHAGGLTNHPVGEAHGIKSLALEDVLA